MKIVHSLYERARCSGEADYLDEALSRARRVASALAASGVNHLGVTIELGICLSLRYRMCGDTGALLEAIDSYRSAIIGADPRDQDFPACLNNLGNALADWYQLSRDDEVLKETEKAFRRGTGGHRSSRRGAAVSEGGRVPAGRSLRSWRGCSPPSGQILQKMNSPTGRYAHAVTPSLSGN